MASQASTPHQHGVNNEFVDIQGGFQEVGNDFAWKGTFFHKSSEGPDYPPQRENKNTGVTADIYISF